MNDNTKAEERGNGLTDAKKVMAATVRNGYNKAETDAAVSGWSDRIPFTFNATKAVDLSLDPKEFAGLSVPKVTEELMSLLRGIDRNANFLETEVAEAADMLANHTQVIPGSDPDFQ